MALTMVFKGLYWHKTYIYMYLYIVRKWHMNQQLLGWL